MSDFTELAIISAPFLVFITATVLYASMFRVRSFQGKAMLFLLVSLVVIFGLNVAINVSPLLGWGIPWYGIAVGAFVLITLAGVVLCVSIVRARKKEN